MVKIQFTGKRLKRMFYGFHVSGSKFNHTYEGFAGTHTLTG